MNPEVTPHVSLSVPDKEAAAAFYATCFGWRETDRTNDWVEMTSGPLKFYLCSDDDASPCFAIAAPDMPAFLESCAQFGCRTVKSEGGETFILDPFGHYFCVTPRA